MICNNRKYRSLENELSKFLNYDSFFNAASKHSKPNILRQMGDIFASLGENKVNLSLGLPNSNLFPFKSVNVCLRNGSSITLEEELLNEVLQYGSSYGWTKLRDWLKMFQDKIHGPRSWETYNLITTTGCQESLSLAVSTFLDFGDAVILQSPTYPGTKSVLTSRLIDIILAETDLHGIKIDTLEKTLQDRLACGKSMPKLMIMNPVGGNPSGITITTECKRKIYKLACDYNFLIAEDDPYYFLNFSEENSPSFLTMDTENRVLRFDSFSKIICPGLRIGFITGPSILIDKMVINIQISSIHSSGLSQALIYKLLMQWQFDGFMLHIKEIRMFYKKKRDAMLQAIENHLQGLVEYVVPSAGFFLWLRLKYIQDTNNLAMKRCLKCLILVNPGSAFFYDGKPSSYVRLSYSQLADDRLDEVMAKLATLIHEEMAAKK